VICGYGYASKIFSKKNSGKVLTRKVVIAIIMTMILVNLQMKAVINFEKNERM